MLQMTSLTDRHGYETLLIIIDKDMPTAVIVYRLSVYFSLCLTVSSLFLPDMKLSSHERRARTDARTDRLAPDTAADLQSSYRTHRSTGTGNSKWNKRPSVYSMFSKMMTRHANRHKNDKAFVDRMFNLFDLDRDRVIERREFKAVLQILGIVSHNF